MQRRRESASLSAVRRMSQLVCPCLPALRSTESARCHWGRRRARTVAPGGALPHSGPARSAGDRRRRQRYRLFEAVAALLALASRARPVLLIFDDLQWADRPTLLMLRHVMRSARAASFTIVATYRESELGRTHPLGEILIGLRREPGVTRFVLRGLGLAHISTLVDSIVGPDAPSQLPQMVMSSTDGNPFFATEILQH